MAIFITPSYILNTVLLKILENLTGFEMILKDLKKKTKKRTLYDPDAIRPFGEYLSF